MRKKHLSASRKRIGVWRSLRLPSCQDSRYPGEVRASWLVLFLVGCGFSKSGSPDQDLSVADLTGVDLAGVDFARVQPDLAGSTTCRPSPLPCLDPSLVIA